MDDHKGIHSLTWFMMMSTGADRRAGDKDRSGNSDGATRDDSGHSLAMTVSATSNTSEATDSSSGTMNVANSGKKRATVEEALLMKGLAIKSGSVVVSASGHNGTAPGRPRQVVIHESCITFGFDVPLPRLCCSVYMSLQDHIPPLRECSS